MPEAMETGILFIARSNHPEKPATMISTAETMNAKVASPSDTPAAPVMSIAAPGVDHAVTTGTL
ncbi:hypothetical protein D3C83_251600 [compost metagenome]